MELQEESSKLGALPAPTSRTLSSSSSAFVSASQSPFFSPRSPQTCGSEPARADIENSKNSITILGDPPTSNINFQQPYFVSTKKLVTYDASSVSSLGASSKLETSGTVFKSTYLVSPYNGTCSPSICSQGTSNGYPLQRDKQRKSAASKGKFTLSRSSATLSSANKLRSCDVYIGYHGQKASLLRFTNWLRAELEVQGISCFSSDRARCRNSRSHHAVERIMNASSFGVVILTKKSFGNPYTIEELKHFLNKKNLCLVFFDLGAGDCHTRDIIERRGKLWEKHGGELWMQYGGLEKEWRQAVDGISRALDCQLEASDGNWRDCISRTVILLATKLSRRSIVDKVNRWKEKVDKEEFPFPRNEEFVGRKKELSQLELILFGDVSGDGEREYFELKTKHRKNDLLIGRIESHKGAEKFKDQQSENSSKGKEPVLWKELAKEIEMQRVGSPQRQFRTLRTKNGGRSRRKRASKMLFGKGVACVSGDSGIGKTELALEFAYRFSQKYKMVLWVGGETRSIRQNYLNLRTFLEVDLCTDGRSFGKGRVKCFEEQEEEAIARVRKALMRDIPFLVVIDNLESEKDWWDRKVLMDLLPRFGGETHFIITTRLPRILNLEPMKLSFLSGVEALSLMRREMKDYSVMELDALRVIEEKLGRLTLGLGIVGAILSELPIAPSRLLETIKRMPTKDFTWNDREAVILRRHAFLIQLIDVCLSIFDHADGPRSLATRMVQVSGWFAPAAIPIPLLTLAAHKVPDTLHRARFWKKCTRLLNCNFMASRLRRSEAEASSMLLRFGLAKSSSKPDCIHFHEIIKLYARKWGATRIAQTMFQAVYQRGSISLCLEHLWAACFLLFGFGSDPVIVEPNPLELMFFVKQVVLPLAIHTFITFSRCNAALELLRLCTDALEIAAESLVSRAEKWFDKSFCCLRPIHSDAQYTYLWQELALSKATVLETRAKLMLRGGQYGIGDDLMRKAIFIRTSVCGEHHPDTVSARETLEKLNKASHQRNP